MSTLLSPSRLVLIALLLVLRAALPDTATSEDIIYHTYANGRFAYTIKYPANILIPQGESSNGDGRKFLSSDGSASLLVWGSHNALDESLESRYNDTLKDAGGSIAYQVLKKNWFVISGSKGDKIFYQKTFFDDGIFKTFLITYPRTKRQLFDPIVKEIAGSFK
jgi:hypothetical protein